MSDLQTRVGGIPSDWKVCRFNEVLTASRSPVVVNKGSQYREIGIRSHGKGIFHKEPVSGADLGDKRVFWVEPDCLVFNIVFAWERAVAVTSAAEKGMIASHRFPMFRPAFAGAVDVEFLRRFFVTDRGAQLLADASPGGAGRNRTLNQKFLAETPLPLPPLPEQRKIAAILSAVDEVIEKTEAVIQSLQALKKAMMQELLTRGLPGRHTRFKQTELGEVPEGWEVVRLGFALLGMDAGWSPQCLAAPPLTDAWGVLKVSAVTSGTFRPEESKALPPDLAPRAEIEVKPGDVILARANGVIELVGRTAFVKQSRPRLMLSDKLLRLRPDQSRLDGRFLHCAFQCSQVRAQLLETTGGSHMRNISQSALRETVLPLPSLDEQRRIADVVFLCDERIEAESDLLHQSSAVKSALMSVLLTGELRVTPDQDAA